MATICAAKSPSGYNNFGYPKEKQQKYLFCRGPKLSTTEYTFCLAALEDHNEIIKDRSFSCYALIWFSAWSKTAGSKKNLLEHPNPQFMAFELFWIHHLPWIFQMENNYNHETITIFEG